MLDVLNSIQLQEQGSIRDLPSKGSKSATTLSTFYASNHYRRILIAMRLFLVVHLHWILQFVLPLPCWCVIGRGYDFIVVPLQRIHYFPGRKGPNENQTQWNFFGINQIRYYPLRCTFVIFNIINFQREGYSKPYFFFRVGIMKCRVRILIVSVVVGFILKYNHYYYYYYYHPYPALNNPNPKREVCSCPMIGRDQLNLHRNVAQF